MEINIKNLSVVLALVIFLLSGCKAKIAGHVPEIDPTTVPEIIPTTIPESETTTVPEITTTTVPEIETTTAPEITTVPTSAPTIDMENPWEIEIEVTDPLKTDQNEKEEHETVEDDSLSEDEEISDDIWEIE